MKRLLTFIFVMVCLPLLAATTLNRFQGNYRPQGYLGGARTNFYDRAVFVGHSWVSGWTNDTYTVSGVVWFTNRYWTNLSYSTNMAIGGTRADYITSNQVPAIISLSTVTGTNGWLFIETGINDFAASRTAVAVFNDVSNICHAAKSNGMFVVCYTEPATGSEMDGGVLVVADPIRLEFNELLRAATFWDYLVDLGMAYNPVWTFHTDGSGSIHPQDGHEGGRLWAELTWQTIANGAGYVPPDRRYANANYTNLIMADVLGSYATTPYGHRHTTLASHGMDRQYGMGSTTSKYDRVVFFGDSWFGSVLQYALETSPGVWNYSNFYYQPFPYYWTNFYWTNTTWQYNYAYAGYKCQDVYTQFTNVLSTNAGIASKSGTNTWLFCLVGFNDNWSIVYGTNDALSSFHTMSNMYKIARSNGISVVAYTLPRTADDTSEATVTNRMMFNELIRTNTSLWDVLVDLEKTFYWNWAQDMVGWTPSIPSHPSDRANIIISDLTINSFKARGHP